MIPIFRDTWHARIFRTTKGSLIGPREGVGGKLSKRLPTASLVENSDICVCVFEEFDIFKVTKTILEAVTLSHCYVTDLDAGTE
jgi:hypothetical protein